MSSAEIALWLLVFMVAVGLAALVLIAFFFCNIGIGQGKGQPSRWFYGRLASIDAEFSRMSDALEGVWKWGRDAAGHLERIEFHLRPDIAVEEIEACGCCTNDEARETYSTEQMESWSRFDESENLWRRRQLGDVSGKIGTDDIEDIRPRD